MQSRGLSYLVGDTMSAQPSPNMVLRLLRFLGWSGNTISSSEGSRVGDGVSIAVGLAVIVGIVANLNDRRFVRWGGGPRTTAGRSGEGRCWDSVGMWTCEEKDVP